MSIDDERTSLNNLVEIFFPLLEQIMSDISQSTSANQILIMYLIAKIFYSANNVSGALEDYRCFSWLSLPIS